MLIVSGASREENRQDLAQQLALPRIPVRLIIRRSRLSLECMRWRAYLTGIQAVLTGDIDGTGDDGWHLPVRRFNPASLITPSGRSLLGQLMKVSRAVIIEDLDVEPEHLKQHRVQFGLPGTAAVFCTGDGFKTQARHDVVANSEWAEHVRGESLW